MKGMCLQQGGPHSAPVRVLVHRFPEPEAGFEIPSESGAHLNEWPALPHAPAAVEKSRPSQKEQ